MSHAATITPDFRSMAQQLVSSRETRKVNFGLSDGSELVPAEALSRMQREGRSFLRRPSLNGATVDQEGLTNNYAVEPEMYYAAFPSQEQARQYAIQGLAAATLIAGLIIMSLAVS
ncbi:ssl1498 family light-harvesting-like protein [Leptolyngbya sp. FACHB-16]|uniref:photosystem II assembly protein Psb34 n=1 Tax=unclassified Leptolyngbya TaxID=2650499 RepID=UPI001686B6C1|nr:ssl1498 family light-harvesting-like protein [Leptolyngbya sp. FACHB-16]MBD2158883.1 ssl1498 family light-harvesting-like protein [Leptolyngbya sp. FACHB-16]